MLATSLATPRNVPVSVLSSKGSRRIGRNFRAGGRGWASWKDFNAVHIGACLWQSGRGAGRVRRCRGSGAAAGSAGPVSYTHLRAHETVLDIVCRLLLEK